MTGTTCATQTRYGQMSAAARERGKKGSMSSQYDVIIIGAGLGGLTAAAQLARAGCRTLLVER
ncbi:FAD-dependent oxidoreductase, partial [Acinetobacter baumannii]